MTLIISSDFQHIHFRSIEIVQFWSEEKCFTKFISSLITGIMLPASFTELKNVKKYLCGLSKVLMIELFYSISEYLNYQHEINGEDFSIKKECIFFYLYVLSTSF